MLTDGLSSDRIDTNLHASKLRADGVKVMAVGVGTSVDHQELLNIAGYQTRVYSLHTVDALHSVLDNSMAGCQSMTMLLILYYNIISNKDIVFEFSVVLYDSVLHYSIL